jgi:hydrogenase maturation protein HypF
VAFSGGVFHNRLLLESLLERFAAVGVRVFRHSAVPAGDGGVALGQLALAAVGGAQALDR